MSGNTCRVTVISREEIPHAGTLRPRLDSSLRLIGSIIIELEDKRRDVAKVNDVLLCSGEHGSLEDGLSDERLVCQAIIALGAIRSKISGLSALSAIPAALAPAVPAVRALSSGLFGLAPESSQRLCELSVGLGSIVVDSAFLTGTSCNFGLSNAESGRLLDEAKLMADSKIDKQHPNLEGTKTNST